MTVFPQCKLFRLSCQHVSALHKSSFNLMTFFLQGHENEMDTILSFMLFHLLMRFSFSWTVKACMPFRVLSRSIQCENILQSCTGVTYDVHLELRIIGINSVFYRLLMKSYFCELLLGEADKPAPFTYGRVKLRDCKWLRKLKFQNTKSLSSF